MLVREETNSVFERMFRAVELVKQRLDRISRDEAQ